MKNLFIFVFVLLSFNVHSQTCTVTTSQTQTNLTSLTCSEGGTANEGDLIIIDGVYVTIDDNGNSTLGEFDITVNSGGTLDLQVKGTITGSIFINNGGNVIVQDQINLNKLEGGICTSSIGIENGGNLRTTGSGSSDIVQFCGTTIIRASGGDCDIADGSSDSEPPYCGSAPGGISGPTGFDEGGENPALPITLLFFNASVADKLVELSWATSSEENFDFFAIERSANAKEYEVIETVPGHGWSDKIINYSFSDNNPLNGRAYYRLKAVDFDGTFEYFQTIMVNSEGASNNVRVASNPVGDQPLQFQLNFTPTQEMNVEITDLSGIQVFSGNFKPGLSQYIVNKEFEKGLYILKVSTGDKIYTSRFLKN